jgi:hypothetical protein
VRWNCGGGEWSQQRIGREGECRLGAGGATKGASVQVRAEEGEQDPEDRRQQKSQQSHGSQIGSVRCEVQFLVSFSGKVTGT